MFELTQAGDCSYYVNAPAKIGVYCSGDNPVYLIDSGNDKDAGRKLLRILEQRGWRLAGIVNTHSNADHIGGNHFIQQKTGCKIFSARSVVLFSAPDFALLFFQKVPATPARTTFPIVLR